MSSYRLRGIVSTLGQLFQYFWRRKLLWLAPLLIVLMLLVAVIVLGSATGLGPWIYPIF